MTTPLLKILGIIPARGASKGLPGKNICPFAGLPLIAHSIYYSQSCPSLTRTVVSTDSAEIASVAKEYGAEVLMREPALAQDDTPIWAVLRAVLEELDGQTLLYDYLALLEPTSPFREVGDLERALHQLEADPAADGIIAVAQYKFNPFWNGFTLKPGGYLEYLVPQGSRAYQRQQVPRVWHHSGELYLWRTRFVRSQEEGWQKGRYLPFETPAQRAVSIDVLEELEWAEGLVNAGMVRLPWLEGGMAYITVEVREEDIENGQMGNVCDSAIARALNRALFGDPLAGKVGECIDCYGFNGHERDYPLPPEVAAFSKRYDNGEECEPFSFTICKPEIPENIRVAYMYRPEDPPDAAENFYLLVTREYILDEPPEESRAI